MLRKIGMQFKKPAGFFGRIISSIMIKGNSAAYNGLIKNLKIQPNDKILEIGYGPGIGINLISKGFNSCRVYGIDFSELMYKRAAKINRQFIDNNRVSLLLGDFLETEISISDFDKVFCLNVIYFWDDLQKPFCRIKSLLKDKGVFSFFMADKEHLSKFKFTKDDIFNKYSIEHVVEALKSAGFENVSYYYEKGYFVKAEK